MNPVPSAATHIAPKDMSTRLYEKLSQFIYDECGIKLPPIKKMMLQSRILKRLRALGMASFEEYYQYLTTQEGRKNELVHTLDVVSTNKTDFFREPSHFDYLRIVVLPGITLDRRIKSGKKIHIWSAGCSSGEEPYSLAMVLSDFLEQGVGFDYDILATDLSQRMLSSAQRAIYNDQDIKPIPSHLKIKYLMRGKGEQKGNCRIVPELRNHIQFRRLNLMDSDFDLPHLMDIIFCRNVIIYFDRPTQGRLFQKIYHSLVPGGLLFIGHSETLYGISNQFEYIQATIYRKPL